VLWSEALTRAKALGAREAYVISNLPFMRSPALKKRSIFTFYRKPGGILTEKSEKDD
jgi:hypothetical protein